MLLQLYRHSSIETETSGLSSTYPYSKMAEGRGGGGRVAIDRHNLPSRPPWWDKVNCPPGVVPPCPRFRHSCYLTTFHQEKGVVSAFTGRLSVHNLNKSWDIPRDYYWHNKMWLRESTFSTHSSSQSRQPFIGNNYLDASVFKGFIILLFLKLQTC